VIIRNKFAALFIFLSIWVCIWLNFSSDFSWLKIYIMGYPSSVLLKIPDKINELTYRIIGSILLIGQWGMIGVIIDKRIIGRKVVNGGM
jgi:hypothetical protein